MEVGVRELKAKLSEYLRLATAGEIVTVTDRGRPVAVLGPPMGAVDLRGAAEAGWLTRATRRSLRPVRRRASVGATVASVLAEDRGE